MHMISNLLLGSAMAGYPSNTGKSFYADLRKGQNGVHYVDFLGGELKEDLDIQVSTSE